MRSRPDISLFLLPRAPVAGQRLVARVRLDVKTETPCDALEVSLVGRERRYRNTTSTGKTTVQHYHRREVFRLLGRLHPGTLRPGTQEHEMAFDIPVDAPPTYRSSLAAVEYLLDVRVDIPWWPDAHEVYDVVVCPPPRPDAAGHARIVTNVSGEQRGEGVALELSLTSDVVAPGGTIRGALSVSGLRGKSLRRVEVACAAVETARVYSAAGPTQMDRRAWVICEGTPREGEAIDFALQAPPDLPPAFVSPFIQVEHALEATAVVAWGSDVSLRVPLLIAPGVAPPAAEQLPMVGRARNLAVWEAAVQQVSIPGASLVRFEPEAARVVFSVLGLRVTAREEARDDAPCLVAEVEYPPQGLELRVAERRWTDLGAQLDGVDVGFQRRFTVRAREAAQAAAVLDGAVCAGLSVFDEAALDDARAVLARRGGVFQVSGLQRFLHDVQRCGAALAAAWSRVPPPRALAAALPAYQRFAQERGAALRVGDLSLHGWAVKGTPIRVLHGWEKGAPTATLLEVALPEGADASRWEAVFSEAFPQRAVHAAGALRVSLPLATDPGALLAEAEAVAEVALRMLRSGASGPYRG